MSFCSQIKERWKSETSEFFKKLRKLAIIVGTSAMAVWMANSTLTLELHPLILSVAKYTIAFCAAVGLTAQITVKDPTHLNNQ